MFWIWGSASIAIPRLSLATGVLFACLISACAQNPRPLAALGAIVLGSEPELEYAVQQMKLLGFEITRTYSYWKRVEMEPTADLDAEETHRFHIEPADSASIPASEVADPTSLDEGEPDPGDQLRDNLAALVSFLSVHGITGRRPTEIEIVVVANAPEFSRVASVVTGWGTRNLRFFVPAEARSAREMPRVVGTIAHEYFHTVSWDRPELKFGTSLDDEIAAYTIESCAISSIFKRGTFTYSPTRSNTTHEESNATPRQVTMLGQEIALAALLESLGKDDVLRTGGSVTFSEIASICGDPLARVRAAIDRRESARAAAFQGEFQFDGRR